MTASAPLLITFGIYLLLMLGIGFAAWRSTRSFDDYILGGRSLGSYVTALSAGASFAEAARLANYAGGLVVMKRGTATVTASELLEGIEGAKS